MADNAVEIGGLRISVFSEGDGTWRLGVQPAGGTVTITPSGTQTVSGTVNVGGTATVGFGGVAQPVSGTVTATPSGTAIVRQESYGAPLTGEIAGGTAAAQLPNVACKLVAFKAIKTNAGNVYIGGSGVTRPDGTTDTTTGYELSAGDQSPWFPVSNLNVLYRISDNDGDDLAYFAVN